MITEEVRSTSEVIQFGKVPVRLCFTLVKVNYTLTEVEYTYYKAIYNTIFEVLNSKIHILLAFLNR